MQTSPSSPADWKALVLSNPGAVPCSRTPSGACRRGSCFYRALRDKSCFLLLQPLMKICLPRIQVWSGSRFAPVSAGQNQTITALRATWWASSKGRASGESPLSTLLPCSSEAYAAHQKLLIRSSEQGFFVLYVHTLYTFLLRKSNPQLTWPFHLSLSGLEREVSLSVCSTEHTMAFALPQTSGNTEVQCSCQPSSRAEGMQLYQLTAMHATRDFC